MVTPNKSLFVGVLSLLFLAPNISRGQAQPVSPSETDLVEIIRDSKDIKMRWKALSSLGMKRNREHLPLLESIVNDKNEDPSTRLQAIRAIGYVGHSASDEFLLKKFKEADEYLEQNGAIFALGTLYGRKGQSGPYQWDNALDHLKEDRIVPFLLSLLPMSKSTDPYAELRRVAMESLGRIQDKRAINPIIELINTGNKIYLGKSPLYVFKTSGTATDVLVHHFSSYEVVLKLLHEIGPKGTCPGSDQEKMGYAIHSMLEEKVLKLENAQVPELIDHVEKAISNYVLRPFVPNGFDITEDTKIDLKAVLEKILIDLKELRDQK